MATLKKVWQKLKEGYLREVIQEIAWIYQYTRRYYKEIILYMLLGLLGASLGLVNSFVSRELTSTVTTPGQTWQSAAGFAALYIGLGLVSLGVGAANSRISAKVSLRVQNEMQADIFTRFLRADWQNLQNYHSGDLLSRLTGDVGTVSGSVLGLIPSLVVSLFQFVASLCIILWYDPVMAVLALLSAPVTLFASRTLMGNMRKHNKNMRAVSSEMMSFHEESFQNIQSIKSFGLIDHFSNQLLQVQKKYRDASLDYNRFSIFASTFMSLVGQVVSYTCLAWGVYRLWTGYIDLAMMVMFLQLAGQLSSSFSSLVGVVPSVIGTTVSARRVIEILDLPAEPELDEQTKQTIKTLQQKGQQTGLSLQLEHISFGYKPEQLILNDISLLANPGEIIALVGASGDGKTTLLRLILSLVDAQEGKGFVQDNAGTRLALSPATRGLFSYVPQGKAAFSGTIADSLRMLNPTATDDELIEALKTACAYNFVSKLPDGINTILGEQGAGLSEGQNQRLSIARALVRNAPILLMDEATSALDVETERKVLHNLMSDAHKRTCIVTSHRPSVFAMCHHVYAIREAKLYELTAQELETTYGVAPETV